MVNQKRVMGQQPIEVSAGLILVLTDEAPMRDGVPEIMVLAGLRAISAPHGPAGIALYREWVVEVRLVLFDLSRPGISDEEMLSGLWRINPNVRVILSSGYSPSEATRRFPAQELAGCLQKPYGADELLETIRQHIGVLEPVH